MFSLVKKSSGMANPGLTLIIVRIIYGLENLWLVCEGVYCEPSTCKWRKILQLGYSKERRVWGKYKVINCGWAWNHDCTWLLLLVILGPLHWFCCGAPQNHIQWGGGQAPSEHHSRPLLTAGLSTSPPCHGQVKACLIQKYEWFSSASSSITL